MNIKKLMATLAFALGAWMSVGVAQADTSYNFNASFGPSSPYDYLTVTGTVTVDPAGGILSVSNLTENSLSVSPVDFTASGHVYSPGYNPWPVNGSGTGNYNFEYNYYSTAFSGQMYIALKSGTSVATCASVRHNDCIFSGADNGPSNVAALGVAPEMNPSHIPQVALMLACLFFLLGRKKENTGPKLTA